MVNGNANNVGSAGECCDTCRDLPGCNTWVYCPPEFEDGCDNGFGEFFANKECFLKYQDFDCDDSTPMIVAEGNTDFISGHLPALPCCAVDSVVEIPKFECNMSEGTNYDGVVVMDGNENLALSAAECCHLCQEHGDCNMWVWCPLDEENGCFDDISGLVRSPRECWLKYMDLPPNMGPMPFMPEFQKHGPTKMTGGFITYSLETVMANGV